MELSDMQQEIDYDDVLYPPMVRELFDAPKLLYVRGDPSILAGPCLSIIGARLCTPYGISAAEMAARIAAQSKLVVVSGGARGIDAAAGRAALKHGGKHAIVLGCGADVVYPKSSAALIEATLEQGGCVISLVPWNTPPTRYSFPRRNRVIAALSAALVITEAGMPSGTFSTAEAAIELQRELLVIPGSIFSAQSRGSNHLIAEGATCIADEEELEVAISRLYGALRFTPQAPSLAELSETEERVLDILLADPLHPDELSQKLELEAMSVLQVLSALEVKGLIERLLDGRLSPTKAMMLAHAHRGKKEGGRHR